MRKCVPLSNSDCKALKKVRLYLLTVRRFFPKFVHVMALKHRWHRQAETEFTETLDYVFREFGLKSAEKVCAEVEQRVRQLCIFPDSGLRYKDLYYNGSEVRILHMRKSSIIYCHDEETVFILAFWNNRNDDISVSTMLSER